jgi:catechol 2,3-dioxygenase-like lactoylglutathione lyase family enzyme
MITHSACFAAAGREAMIINPEQPSRLPPALPTRYRRKSLDVFHGVAGGSGMANHGLLHIALLTRDLKKTERFYTGVLGLKVAFRVPPNMVFLRSPASQDLINFVGTKKRISANDALQHFGFKTTKAGLTSLEKKLKENEIEIEGRRGKHAIYFSDPNGYTLEYYCD